MTRKDKLNEINSVKVKSITRFTNNLHDLVAELYEGLIDDDVSSARKAKVEMVKNLTELKIDFQ